MDFFKSRVFNNNEEITRSFFVQVTPAKDPATAWTDPQDGKQYDSYYVFDSKKSWREKEGWQRVIKTASWKRINFANKRRMSQYDIDIVDYINHTYPIPKD